MNRPNPSNRWRAIGLAKALAFFMFLFAATVLASPATHADEFTEDADAAVKKAVAEGKDVLLLFTGSDWCPPCKKLEAEVFSKPEFLESASKDFVLIKFDFPRSTPQDDAIAAQNKEWASKFGIGSYPTVVLADNQLSPIRFTGYQDGGPENYLNFLAETKAKRVLRDEKLQAAEKAEGDEKAKLLDEALTEIGEEIAGVYYADIIEQIVEIDNDNRLGLRGKWNAAADAEMRKIVITDLLMMSRIGKPEAATALIEEVMAEIDFTNSEKLTLLQLKLNLAKTFKDPQRVDKVLDEMINLDGVQGTTQHRLIAKKAYLMVGSGRRAEALKLLETEISKDPKAGHLYLAQGQLLAAKDQHELAIESYDAGLERVVRDPDLAIELVSGKADSLYASKKEEDALKVLDDFADNENMPSELRAESLLHKAMMVRSMGRDRQARLTENRAIELTESAEERAAIQKIVTQLRRKSEDQ